jgi:thioredoxin 2
LPRRRATLEPQVRLAKLDTEAHPQVAAPYNIRSIPTMVLFQGGREVARISGARHRALGAAL